MGIGRTFHETELLYAVMPQLVDNDTVETAWVPVTNANRILALISVGATDITVDAKIQQATDSSGTGAKDITGAAITQIAADGDNRVVSIDLEANHMDINNGFNHVQLQITVGNGSVGAYVAGQLVLRELRHRPPSG